MTNFDIIPENIKLKPFKSTEIFIRYCPSNLDIVESGEIFLSTSEIGNWKFLVYGKGLPPTQF